jgi:hypothetical protein
MGVPGCIQEDSLPKVPMLLKDKSQIPQHTLDIMTTIRKMTPSREKKKLATCLQNGEKHTSHP